MKLIPLLVIFLLVFVVTSFGSLRRHRAQALTGLLLGYFGSWIVKLLVRG